MNRLQTLLATIAHYCAQVWGWIFGGRRKPTLYSIARVDEEPQRLNSHVLYVIEDAGIAWSAMMACPCGCGAPLHMNLIPDTKPVWRLDEGLDGTPTLAPSVWRTEECCSHFFLRRGRIEWCEGAPPSADSDGFYRTAERARS